MNASAPPVCGFSVRPVQLEPAASRSCRTLQVLDVEADVVEHPPFGGDGRHVGFGKAQIRSRYVGGLVLSAHPGLRAECLGIPGLDLRYRGFRHPEMDVVMLDRELLGFVFQNLDPQFVRRHDKRLIGPARGTGLDRSIRSLPLGNGFLCSGR